MNSCKKTNEELLWIKLLNEGKLIFYDYFDRENLGENWISISNTWKIVNSSLFNYNAMNVALWLNEPLPDNVKIEFDAKSALPPGAAEKFRGDIKCEAFGKSKNHESGYVFIFGGWMNTVSVLAKGDEHASNRLERTDKLVIPDKWYKMKIIRYKGEIRWYIDDFYFFGVKDRDLSKGGFFGFNNWKSYVFFDNFKVYDLSAIEEKK